MQETTFQVFRSSVLGAPVLVVLNVLTSPHLAAAEISSWEANFDVEWDWVESLLKVNW